MSASKVGIAGAIMMASLFLSRVLGLVRDAVMAAKFGATDFTDAYRYSFSIPDLIFFLIAGGALSSAFIPVFSEYLHTDREDEAWHVFSVVVTVMSVVLVVLISILFAFALQLSHLVAPGAKEELFPLIAQMSQIILPAQYAFFIGGIMFGTLYAKQVFAVPGLGPNVYNIGIILGALVLGSFIQPGVVGMSWGALAGAVIGNLVIPLFAMKAIGVRFKISFDVRHPGVVKVFRLMLPVVLGLSLPGVYQLIMNWFGSFSAESGFVTSLDLANRIQQAPLAILGQSLAIAAFPTLSRFWAMQRRDLYSRQLESTVRTVAYMAIPVSAILIVFPVDVARIIFERKAFTAADTVLVGESLRLFAVGVCAWCLHPVLMRAFFSMQRSLLPIALGSGTTFVFVALILLLRETPMGLRGLPLAGSLSAIFLALILGFAIKKTVPEVRVNEVLVSICKSGLAAALAFGLVWGLQTLFPTTNYWVSVIRVAVGGLGGAWIYYGVTRLLKMPETDTINRALGRLDRRTKPPEKPDDAV